MEENRLKISSPERIERILRRICQASLQVIVRAEGATVVAVKGRAASLTVGGASPAMRISNISEKGISHLGKKGRVQVEFIMMSTKVVFVSSILSRDDHSVLVTVPSSLVSIERRKNSRYPCTEDLTSFVDLSIWKPTAEDITASPYFGHLKAVGSLLHIADVSFGGLCFVTRFPGVNTVLKRGIIDDRAKIILPMHEPIELALEVRWCKKIKEHVKDGENLNSFTRLYRFGVEFVNPSERAIISLRQFIQQLSQAGAI